MEELSPLEREALLSVMERIEKLKEDLEALGVDVTVVVKDTPPGKSPGLVLHLTAIIRKELEEDVG